MAGILGDNPYFSGSDVAYVDSVKNPMHIDICPTTDISYNGTEYRFEDGTVLKTIKLFDELFYSTTKQIMETELTKNGRSYYYGNISILSSEYLYIQKWRNQHQADYNKYLANKNSGQKEWDNIVKESSGQSAVSSSGGNDMGANITARQKLESRLNAAGVSLSNSQINSLASGGDLSKYLSFDYSINGASISYINAYKTIPTNSTTESIKLYKGNIDSNPNIKLNGYTYTDAKIYEYKIVNGNEWFKISSQKWSAGKPDGFVSLWISPSIDKQIKTYNSSSSSPFKNEGKSGSSSSGGSSDGSGDGGGTDDTGVYGGEDEFYEDFDSVFYEDESKYYEDLYWFKRQSYSAKSFNSIIGLPVQFMGNVDMRFGGSTYGQRYTEDILYDAPICIIQPGTPSYQTGDDQFSNEGVNKLINSMVKTHAWIGAIKNDKETAFKQLLTEWFLGKYNRFFGFSSEYNKYIEYTNTLCHLFTSFLGISDKTIPGTNKQYRNYNDTIEEVEYADNGLSLKMLYGNYPGMFVYYQPDSSLGQQFSNQTQASALADKLASVSNSSKEAAFFAGAVGINGRNGAVVGNTVETGLLDNLASGAGNGSTNILTRIFSRAGEGIGTLIGGNNLSLPEIYYDSNMSGTEYSLHVRLVNPYGTPEGAFLFQLRQLARLLAISLPRQYGPNGYTSPFIVRAFSKGQFNVQLGIVTSLTINRAGDGGSNQTVHGIPMELEVSMTIKDLYEQLSISNEYGGGINRKGMQMLFNNIGLLDFVASYAGYNMNQPMTDMKFDYIIDRMTNEWQDIFQGNWKDPKTWKFPRWNRMILDSYLNEVETRSTWMMS